MHGQISYFESFLFQFFKGVKYGVVFESRAYDMLSAFNREVVSNGYLTQLGIFHDNVFNSYNLSSDLMEPYRILVDRKAYQMKLEKFEHEEKMQMVNLLNQEVFISDRKEYINNAIRIYTKSVLDALSERDISLIRFYRNEL